MRRSPSTHFDLVSHWRVAAPVDRVWAALADPESWPQWWPYVLDVQTLSTGAADGLGSLRRIRWATRLPYQLLIEVEAIEVLRPERLRARSQGQLRGEGLWLLRSDGPHTDITYVWRVELTRRWMRALAPLLAPVFRWNHAAVMRAGEAGLNRRLAAPDLPTCGPQPAP
jgi:hypothetical protein